MLKRLVIAVATVGFLALGGLAALSSTSDVAEARDCDCSGIWIYSLDDLVCGSILHRTCYVSGCHCA